MQRLWLHRLPHSRLVLPQADYLPNATVMLRLAGSDRAQTNHGPHKLNDAIWRHVGTAPCKDAADGTRTIAAASM